MWPLTRTWVSVVLIVASFAGTPWAAVSTRASLYGGGTQVSLQATRHGGVWGVTTVELGIVRVEGTGSVTVTNYTAPTPERTPESNKGRS